MGVESLTRILGVSGQRWCSSRELEVMGVLGVLGLVVSPSSERDERRPEPRLPWHAWPWAWPWPWGHTTTLLLLLLVPARAGLGPAGDLHVGESSSSPSSPSTLSDGHDELRRLSPRPLCNAQETSLVEGRHNRGNGGWLCPLHPPPTHTHAKALILRPPSGRVISPQQILMLEMQSLKSSKKSWGIKRITWAGKIALATMQTISILKPRCGTRK